MITSSSVRNETITKDWNLGYIVRSGRVVVRLPKAFLPWLLRCGQD